MKKRSKPGGTPVKRPQSEDVVLDEWSFQLRGPRGLSVAGASEGVRAALVRLLNDMFSDHDELMSIRVTDVTEVGR